MEYPLPRAMWIAVRDAALVTAGCAVVAFGTNALRSMGIPVVAREPYQILVPCPDEVGESIEMAADDARLRSSGTLLIDARDTADYAAWHLERARSVPYDFLDPVNEKAVQEIASTGASVVAVYGDGAEPDSGRELAREIAGKGIRNVHHVVGGAPALQPKAPDAADGGTP